MAIQFITVELSTEEFNKVGVDLAWVMVQSNLAQTKSEARRQIKAGGVRLDDKVVKDPFARLVMKDEQVMVVEHANLNKFFQ